MSELRILSGLHRGATLPLDERSLVIGASEDADVVLVDPGIETQHATLTLTAQGWSLSALDGAVLSADNNRPLTSLELQAGDFARLGHVWLTVADSESRWENPPPEPVQSDASEGDAGVDASEGDAGVDASADDADSPHEQPNTHADDGVEEYEPYRDSPLDDPQNTEAGAPDAGEQSALMAEAAEPAAAAGKRAGYFSWIRSKMVLAPIALVTILSACAAYTITSRSSIVSKTPDAPRAEPRAESRAESPKPSPQISQQELREAFRKRLKDVDLLKRFDLDLRNNEWTMQASLDDDEAARFERILATFMHAHNITFPVRAKIGNAEAMLPFQISEVISGANASIVTEDGNRLYIGDKYRGMRLVAIEGNQLKFDGKRKIKVKW